MPQSLSTCAIVNRLLILNGPKMLALEGGELTPTQRVVLVLSFVLRQAQPNGGSSGELRGAVVGSSARAPHRCRVIFQAAIRHAESLRGAFRGLSEGIPCPLPRDR